MFSSHTAAGRWFTVGTSALAVAISVGIRLLEQRMPPVFAEQPPLILFMMPILVAAMFGGGGPALVTTAVAVLCAQLILLHPHPGIDSLDPANQVRWISLIVCGVLAGLLGHRLQRMRASELAALKAQISDIEARKDAEARLLQNEERLRHLLTHFPEPVIVAVDRCITFANVASQRLFGLTEEEMLGRRALDFVDPGSSAESLSGIEPLRRGQVEASLGETEVLHTDGTVRIVQPAVAVLNSLGQRAHLVLLRDVTDLRRTEGEREQYRTDLQSLVAAQYSAEEGERKRIARELHDELLQTLGALKMGLESMSHGAAAEHPGLSEPLARSVDLAKGAIDSTRRIVNGLRPQALDELGIGAALKSMASEFSRRTGIVCEVDISDDDADAALASPQLATCLYRIAQEALHNVSRHAQASHVEIQLQVGAVHGVTLRVSDNGRGLAPQDLGKRRAFGLLGMRERVRELSGTIQVKSAAVGGTTVEVKLPLGGSVQA